MGVYIPGMEMPTNCQNCELSARVDLDYGYGYCCQILAEMISNTHERKTNCPLIEVPEHHGDLIDRDNLLHKIGLDSKDPETVGEFVYKTINYLDALSKAPAIISASKEAQ